ncbi:MAG: TlpA family protein disulfide reductase [Acidobacteria bacterium]|nr:MAG: TlpA family protein disulfide reductase [Acidobacteriota bacterium]
MKTKTTSPYRSVGRGAALAVALVLALVLGPAAPAGAAGEPEPTLADLVARDLDGRPFDPRSLAGKVVLVDFWAVWCVPCIASFPTLAELHRELAPRGFTVLGAAAYSGTADDVRSFLAERDPLPYPIVLVGDETVARFGVVGLPTYVLFAPDGTVAERFVGELADLHDRVVAAATRLLAAGGSAADPPRESTSKGE